MGKSATRDSGTTSFAMAGNPTGLGSRATAASEIGSDESPISALEVSPKTVGDRALVEEAAARLDDLVKALKGQTFRRTTAWRFVTGLGRSHPVENGFAWHHILGTPYLPGSSLKGLARAYARDWEGLSAKDVERIFGPRPEAALTVGSIAFLDALPVAPVALEADVMTPHYGPWYQDGKPPGDWHSPTPIPFLTVAPDQTFLFAVLPRNPAKPECREDCKRALSLLDRALETLGAGAKTAVGYGQFVAQREHEVVAGRGSGKVAMERPQTPGPAGLVGREAVVYDEVARIIEDRGGQLLVRFRDGSEEVIERGEAKLR